MLRLLVFVAASLPAPATSLLLLMPQQDIVTGRRRQQQQQPARMVGPQQLGTFEALDLSADLRLDEAAVLSTQEEEARHKQQRQQQQQRLVVLENWIGVGGGGGGVGTPSTQTAAATKTQGNTVPFDEAWKRQQRYWQEHADRLLLQQQQQQQGRRSAQGGAPYGEEDASSSFYRPPIHNFHNEAQHVAAASAKGVDRVLFLQHDPVYTLGTGSDPTFILESNSPTIPVVRMDRGGEVTYHGPGQLVAYPVLDLRGYRQDIHWYMRALEEAVIVALHDMGLTGAGRDPETTGVWIDNCKVAAVGVKCRKWVTMHGLAVNVERRSLAGFDGIVPCGLHGRRVGCVSHFAGRHVTVAEFADRLKRAMEKVFRIQFVEIAPLPPSD
jgi:lipoyl(octanoyl) transferase